MRLIRKATSLRKTISEAKRKNKIIAFVPTMGDLHSGHKSLLRAARKKCDLLVMSIFVNPIQFGPKEDYKKYPRDLSGDTKTAIKCGVDVIFYPDAKEMYPKRYSTYVTEEKLSSVMCGRSRPGHFRGVVTVVVKLLNLVRPDIVFFGQKDYQQAMIIKKVIGDLNMPVKLRLCPTVRDKDGLAMSSRNKYLSFFEKKKAINIYKALKRKKISKKIDGVKLDYFIAVDKDTLRSVKKIKKGTLIAAAGWVGKTRLIDNIVI